jgi:ribosomal protein L11 methyltransferase
MAGGPTLGPHTPAGSVRTGALARPGADTSDDPVPDGEPRTTAETRRSTGSVHRVDVEVRADRAEQVAAALWARGATGVWERPGTLVAWFDGVEHPSLGEVPGVAELAVARQRWSVEPDRDWQAEWKHTIEPVRAGRVMVVPTWLADAHRPADTELTLVLDPGRAFGSGHHATTVLCLELLDEMDLRGSLSGRTVADVGCGTGVLAIAAAAWGAAVTAVDIDPDAVEVTGENAARNQVALDTTVGSVDAVPGTVDVVVANLVTDVVVDLAAELVAATRDTLIVSGIARERRDRALDALHAHGARTIEVRERDGWIAARLESDAGRRAGA